ncbi:hypothetical protein HYH03_013161 [Edaphochlamys debaryana]|uniref:Nucleoside diphosphate kinase-like domain-containing protein n=1 Tax=Edaphochlamys debaryana TaxID=47281 RepID=A0A835XQM4_9CHLO|nr:hypothetical protein HYH03_013161 [Edaphochlamys debaryana]|eukprot:KAG2488311.1 hypothetical protein HYH03_013161 [Edaphochlamys debaryana]
MAELEKTFAIIKPDAVRAGKAEEIMQLIELNGFTIIAKQKLQLTKMRAEEFYGEHKGKDFFPRLVAYMTSGPVWALVLAKPDAIKGWRALMGPTNVLKAREEQPKCLRALYGTDNTQNATHGSDAPGSAAREIKFFFPHLVPEPVTDPAVASQFITTRIQPALSKALAALAREKPSADKFEAITFVAGYLLQNNPNKPKVLMPDEWDPALMGAEEDDEAEFLNARPAAVPTDAASAAEQAALLENAKNDMGGPPAASSEASEPEPAAPERPPSARPTSARPPSARPGSARPPSAGAAPPPGPERQPSTTGSIAGSASGRVASRQPSVAGSASGRPLSAQASAAADMRPLSAQASAVDARPPSAQASAAADVRPPSAQASAAGSVGGRTSSRQGSRQGSRPGSASAAPPPPPPPAEEEEDQAALEDAATKVQAAFRGYQARKEVAVMRAEVDAEPGVEAEGSAPPAEASGAPAPEPSEPQAEPEAEAEPEPQPEPSEPQPEVEAAPEAEREQSSAQASGLDLPEGVTAEMAEEAATLVQAHMRGYLARKQVAEIKAQRGPLDGSPSEAAAEPQPEPSEPAAEPEPEPEAAAEPEPAAEAEAELPAVSSKQSGLDLPDGVTEEMAEEAATLVQAHMRGFLARKQVAEIKAQRATDLAASESAADAGAGEPAPAAEESAAPEPEPAEEEAGEPTPEGSGEPAPEEAGEPAAEEAGEPAPEASGEPAPEDGGEAPPAEAEPAPEEAGEGAAGEGEPPAEGSGGAGEAEVSYGEEGGAGGSAGAGEGEVSYGESAGAPAEAGAGEPEVSYGEGEGAGEPELAEGEEGAE